MGPYPRCGSCGRAWQSWAEFLHDPELRLLGLQAVLTVADASLLVYEHSCGSSVSVLTRRLRHLLPAEAGEADWPSLRFTDACPGHCHSLPDREACDTHCRHARDRRLVAHLAEAAARSAHSNGGRPGA